MSKEKNVETIYLEDEGADEDEGEDKGEGITFRYFYLRHFSFDQSLENHFYYMLSSA